MATARLMETWAHGQDVADALGVLRAPHPGCGTSRTSACAPATSPTWCAIAAPPAEPFRVELDRPGRRDLDLGRREDATQSVTGPALDFCLLVTQRRHRDDLALVAVGADADEWLDIAQAFAGPPGEGRGRRPARPRARARIGTAPLRDRQLLRLLRRPRLGDARMLTGGPLDVLTGDYLAELTMLILGRDRMQGPNLGYAKTFLRQLENSLGTALERGREDRRQRRRAQPGRAGRGGPRAGRPARPGRRTWRTSRATTCARGPPSSGWANRSPPTPTSARWASPNACAAGADRSSSPGGSPTPRWWSGRRSRTSAGRRDDLDALAGAVVAGHVIECGPQATGGNYAFFGELDDLDRPLGLPDRRDERRRLVGDHQAPRHGRRGHRRHGHRAAAVRDRRRALRRARRHRPLRHDRARRGRAGPRADQRRARRAAAADAQGRAEHARRVPQRDDVRPHRHWTSR